MRKRRISVVTTSRADYGSLRELLKEIHQDAELELLLVVTGMHMLPAQGMTIDEIAREGFPIARRIEMLLGSDDETSMAKSIGVGLMGFADAFLELAPDVVVLMGDRFELLAPAIAALMHRIPIAHLHGGETSEGAVDEAVRHSITKMASLHFAATEEYRRRIVQMGEDPAAVYNFGAPALDALRVDPVLSRSELEEKLQFDLSGTVALVTYHPVTLEAEQAEAQIEQLLDAIAKTGVKALFTMANADAQGSLINSRVRDFCARDPASYRLYCHLGHRVYMSCLRHLQLMVGNSSSGLVEAPSFALPVVNVGNRQRGRVKAANVIDVSNDTGEILRGIGEATSKSFREGLSQLKNPYQRFSDGSASRRIKEVLKTAALDKAILKKTFRAVEV